MRAGSFWWHAVIEEGAETETQEVPYKHKEEFTVRVMSTGAGYPEKL